MNDYILYIIIPVIIGVVAMALQFQYMHTTESKRRAWSLGGIAVLWIPAVLIVARYLCSYARTVEECFLLWTAAFCISCIAAAIQFSIMLLTRNRRDLSEVDKMKLKDI